MKRLIACALLLAMLLTLFAGCNSSAEQQETTPATDGVTDVVVDTGALDAAAEYVKTIYKDAEESTPVDYQRISSVRIGTESFGIVWTADVGEDQVKITDGGNGMVTVDVSDSNPEDVPYVLTATISDANGNTRILTWNHFLPAAIVGDFSQILDMAYALEAGEAMPNACTLTGIISSINTAWSDDYQNITVTIIVDGIEDKPIMCYRLQGEGAKDLAPGDQITVTGTIKNYNGTIEFDAACNLDEVVKGVGEVAEAPEDPAQIMEEAYALPEGQALPYTATLTGEIIMVNTAWSDQYQNITVTIEVEGTDGKTIQCFRLKGDGAKDLWKEDVITVTGTVKNYYGTIEFDAGCQLIDVVPGRRYHGKLPKQPDDPLQIVDEAYQLTEGSNLPYNVRISGYVTNIVKPWDDTYHYITVNIVVPGREDKPIQCYHMHGSENGADTLQVGDYITVFGSIKNYEGLVEFYAGAHCEKVVKGDGKLPWVDDPTPISIADAIALGQTMKHNTYTTEQYYVTGVITEVYNTTYGNMKIKDSDGNILTIYGTYSADGKTRYDMMDVKPVAGDTVTILGSIGQYNGTSQIKNGWITEHIPAPAMTPEEIVDAAYVLAQGESLDGTYTLTGEITSVDTAYSSQYGNITVTIAVPGKEDKPIQCFRLKGTGADVIRAGDTITVTGTLKNYKGTIEFDAGCTLDAASLAAPYDNPGRIVLAAYALGSGKSLEGTYTLTGEITKVNTAYDPSFSNVTVTIAVPGYESKTIQCFRLKGTGADVIKVGDTITVTGTLKNYNGTIEFDAGCTLDSYVAGEEPEVPAVDANSSLEEVLAAAAYLENGQYFSFETTVTTTVYWAGTYYEQHGNRTINVYVGDVYVQCYRLTGEGVAELAKGDAVTITGYIGKNSSGNIAFKEGCILTDWTDNTP